MPPSRVSVIAISPARSLAPFLSVGAKRRLRELPCLGKVSGAPRGNCAKASEVSDTPQKAIRPGCPSVSNAAPRAPVRIDHQLGARAEGSPSLRGLGWFSSVPGAEFLGEPPDTLDAIFRDELRVGFASASLAGSLGLLAFGPLCSERVVTSELSS
jgi:hypothetical protein